MCTENYCQNLTTKGAAFDEYGIDAKYIKCPGSPKCILNARVCDSIPDCPNGEDEKNCTEEECSRLGKFKCPNENKCILNRFVCKNKFPPWSRSKSARFASYHRNKCNMNMDCYERCLKKEGTHYLCPKEGPFRYAEINERSDEWQRENCLTLEKRCIADPDIVDALNLTENHLWRCSKNSFQFIHVSQVCDQKFDCLSNEDESDNVCKQFPLTRALLYSITVVSGLVIISIVSKSFNLYSHSWMCKQCLLKHCHELTIDEWKETRRLLTFLIGNRCKEFATSNNSLEFFSRDVKMQNQAYENIHKRYMLIRWNICLYI